MRILSIMFLQKGLAEKLGFHNCEPLRSKQCLIDKENNSREMCLLLTAKTDRKKPVEASARRSMQADNG